MYYSHFITVKLAHGHVSHVFFGSGGAGPLGSSADLLRPLGPSQLHQGGGVPAEGCGAPRDHHQLGIRTLLRLGKWERFSYLVVHPHES